MSASFTIGAEVIPVSSRTSRRAASRAFSPASTSPLGRQRTGFERELAVLRLADLAVRGVETLDSESLFGLAGFESLGSSIAAIHQSPSLCRTTTPPADISRTILSAR